MWAILTITQFLTKATKDNHKGRQFFPGPCWWFPVDLIGWEPLLQTEFKNGVTRRDMRGFYQERRWDLHVFRIELSDL